MLRCARIITLAVLLPALTSFVHAQERTKTGNATVAGKWSMFVTGTPHGDLTLGLTLEQHGTGVKGTFASPHGDLPVEGEFSGGTLKLATVVRNADTPQITFTGTLQDDGTLAGSLSSERGDMTWTATRVDGGGAAGDLTIGDRTLHVERGIARCT